MLDLIWEPDARAQLAGILEYISARNPDAAQRLQDLVNDRLRLARVVPSMGRPGRVSGSRELVVHPNYIVIYQVVEDAIDVVRVLHSRQQYP